MKRILLRTCLIGILTAWVSITVKAQTPKELGDFPSRLQAAKRTLPKAETTSPPGAAPVPSHAASKVRLTGFTTLGAKHAFFLLIDEKTNASQPLSLTMDEEVGGLKLIGIDPVARSVRVLQDGLEKDLTFERDGIAGATAIAASPAISSVSRSQPASTRPASSPNAAQSPSRSSATPRGGQSATAPVVMNPSSPSRSGLAEAQSSRNRRPPAANRSPRR